MGYIEGRVVCAFLMDNCLEREVVMEKFRKGENDQAVLVEMYT